MREVEKCLGPGSLFEGLDAVLCEPMPLQGFSEPEARSYREVELVLQTVRPLQSGFYQGTPLCPGGSVSPVSWLYNSPHRQSCAEHIRTHFYRPDLS